MARLCAAGGPSHSLRLALLDELRTVVDFDAHVWLLTDPRTAVGAAPLAAVPSLPALRATIKLKYGTTTNRWTHLPQARPVGLLRAAVLAGGTDERWWHHLREAHGVSDVASVVLRDRYGCWAFLDLWRVGPSPPFDEADAERLVAVAGMITTALRVSQADTFATAAPPSSEEVGPMVLILDEDLRVVDQTEAATRSLQLLLPAPAGAQPVPAAAYNVAAQLQAVESGADDQPPWSRVHLAGGRWLTLGAARLGADRIAVTIERTSPSDRLDLFCRSHALSDRETELVLQLAGGGDTRAAADQLHLSVHTVQDHLKSIFDKAGVRSRSALLSRAFGTT